MSIQEELNRLTQAKVDIKGALDRLGVECVNDKLEGLADALGTIQKVEAKQESGVIKIPVGYISEEQTFVVGSDLSTGYLVNGEDGNVYFQAVKIVDGEAVADGEPVKITGLDIPNIGDVVPVYPPPPSAEAELVTGYIVNNDDGSVYFQQVGLADGGLGDLNEPVKISEVKIVDTATDEPDYVSAIVGSVTAVASDVSAGSVFYGVNGIETGTMPDVELSISRNVVSIPAGRIRKPQEKSISLGRIEREGGKITVSEGYVEPGVIEFPEASVNVDGGKITITEGYTEQLQIEMVPGYTTVDKNRVKINQGFYYDETVTIPYGKAEINEDQTKVIITEGYLDSAEIEIPNSGESSGNLYKCVSVDAGNKTWVGLEAVLTGGIYVFDTTETHGLIYTDIQPEVGGIYPDGANFKIEFINTGRPTDYVFFDSLSSAVGWEMYGASVVNDEKRAVFQTINDWSDRQYAIKSENPGVPLGNAPRSLSFWFKRTEYNDSCWCGIGYGMSGSNQRMAWGLVSNYPGVTYWAHDYFQSEFGEVYDYNWHHWVVTFDGDVTECFMDGEKVWTWNSGSVNTQWEYINVGDPWEGYQSNGRYADYYIFPRALQKHEIKMLYSNRTV